jgi:4-nitrophenyl phosphatase
MPKRYAAYIFDLDGTLFRGDEPVPGAAESLRRLAEGGARLRYLTNNSTRSREFYAAKLNGMGFLAKPEEVYSSGLGTAKYLNEQGLGSAFVVGEQGLRDTLMSDGIRMETLNPDAVVVGLSKSFNYDQMNQAMQLIRTGAKFVATNADATYPMEGAHFVPGAGSVVAAIRTCSETEPFVVGKPNPYLVKMILADLDLASSEVLVVGDRDDTDIESGRRAGCDTCLVLTGHASKGLAGELWLDDVNGLLAA